MAPPYKPVADVNPATNPAASGPPKPSGGGLTLGAPPPPPPKKGGKGTQFEQYAAWAKKHGIARSTAADIWYWSKHTPNVDPYLWSSVLLAESGAKHLKGNGSLVSSGQAVGIGQIANSWVGQPIPWNPGKKFTADNNPQTGIGNYGVNLRMSATLWGNAVAQYGWQNAYTSGYNPNDSNNHKAWATISKTYGTRPAGHPPVGSPSSGPADTSATAQVGTSTDNVFRDLYVTGITGVGNKTKLSLTADPNKAMQYNGLPMTRSTFLTLKDQLTSHFISYTGGRPNDRQIVNYVKNNWNPYTLDVLLSKGKKFKKSPIYKQYAANITASVKDLLPANGKVNAELIRQAVVNNWSGEAVADKLRKQPGYIASKEFKNNFTSLLNVHDTIMGNATPEDLTSVKEAALAGWTADQYAAYLRQHKNYTHSTEYQSKSLDFLSSLGLITGARPVLGQGVTPGPGYVAPTQTAGNIPNDKRVAGNPNTFAAPLPGLGATLA